MPVSTQPRYHKRIDAVKQEGISTHSLSFKRDYVPAPSGAKVEVLGRMEPGSYLKRLIPILRAVPKVRSKARDSDVLYAFGLDMLLLSWLSLIGMDRKPALIYEVADIRDILIKDSITGAAVRAIQRFLLRKCKVLVVTSKAYMTKFFQEYYQLEDINCKVIENKIDESHMSSILRKDNFESHANRKKVTIGYFGLIRCSRSCAALARSSSDSNNVSVKIRGVEYGGVSDLAKLSNTRDDFVYGGPYVNPDDLPGMYGSVDIVWACYPYSQHDTGNWRWARTNRFYEALFFGRPLIAQSGTEDAKYVERYKVGLVIDLGDLDFASQQISNISRKDIQRWTQNIDRIPRSVYVYTDEHRGLVQAAQEQE